MLHANERIVDTQDRAAQSCKRILHYLKGLQNNAAFPEHIPFL